MRLTFSIAAQADVLALAELHTAKEAVRQARARPANAIRLDAFDAEAGAEGFYAKCGFLEVGRVTYRKAPLISFELVL
jgi:hypothetical protein